MATTTTTPNADAAQKPVAPTAPAAVSGQPRNFFTTMLLASFLGTFGFHKIYLGDKTLGWTRFGIGVGAIVTSWIPFFNIISCLALAVLWVWAVIDLFQIYLKRHTDAEGQELVATERDKAGAKALFIYTIVSFSLGILTAIVVAIFVAFIGIGLSSVMDSSDYHRTTNPSYEYRYER